MHIGFKHLVIIACLLAAGGLALAWSGLFNVAASTGHWAVTDWFLHWTMRNSVKTHAMGIEVPPLDDEAMVQRGAGHFAAGCAPCHGAPGADQPAVVREMTPKPPPLAERIEDWEPNHLFWIVRHGVKYTGMPAWPAEGRDDEVWSVVAFLLRLPELDAKGYAELAFGDAPPLAERETLPKARLKTLLDGCISCHGEDGQGRAPGAFPNLPLQTQTYLQATLKAYAGRDRQSGIMQLAASGLDQTDIQALAGHYAEAAPASENAVAGRSNDPPGGHGETIAMKGLPEDRLPACDSCHGGDEARYDAYPALAGLDMGYLETQLELFKAGDRGGTPYSDIMTAIATRMSAEQIADVSAYYGRIAGD